MVHASTPSTEAEYIPWLQDVHVLDSAAPVVGENLPAAHLVQSVSGLIPVDTLYFPTPQEMQLVMPVAGWYNPTAQSVQLPAVIAEYLPDEQLVQELATATEYLPALQL